jgi:hypothetical protein
MTKALRMKTRDAAFGFRMGAGFPGDVNRTHPANIEPAMADVEIPPTAFGQGLIVAADGQALRPMVTGDAAQALYGVSVRPFPYQQSSATNFGATAFGAATPPPGVIDALRSGYIMTSIPVGQAPIKGGPVYVWVAASAGAHVMGGFEAVASGANTVLISNAQFNGAPDSSGNVELMFNI